MLTYLEKLKPYIKRSALKLKRYSITRNNIVDIDKTAIAEKDTEATHFGQWATTSQLQQSKWTLQFYNYPLLKANVNI